MPTSSAAPSTDAGRPQKRIFGRRHGPKLRPGRQLLLDQRLPQLAIALPPDGQHLDLGQLFGDDRPLWLEIGFGGGEHLAAQAAAHPEVGFVGVEPFVNGVARLIDLLEHQASSNARILVDDARLLLAALPDASIERVFVLFPDPWPKLRHHKRRIVSPATVRELARVMTDGGELRLATDHPEYARWMLAVMLGDPDFEWLAERAADWRGRPPDWPATRYEHKAASTGRPSLFFRFARTLRCNPAQGIRS